MPLPIAGGRQRCVARHLSTFARALASPNPQASRGSQARPPFPSPKTCHSGEPQSNPDRSDNGSGGNGFGSQLSPQDSGIEAPGEAGSTAEKRPPVAAVLAEMRQRLNRANGKRGGVAGHSDGPAETSGKQAAMSDVTGYRERPHLPAFKHAPPTALLSTPAPQTAVERVAEGPPFMSELPSAKSDLYPSTPSEEMGNGYHKASNLQDGFGTGVAKSHSQELSESALQSSPQSFRTTPLRTPPPSTPLSSNSSWSFPPSLSPSRRYPDVSSASPPLEVRPDPADAASSSAPQDSPNGVSSVRRLPPMKLRSRSLFRRSGVLREERSENGASTSDRGPGDERSRTSDDRTASSGSVLRTAEASDVETGQFGTRERILTERNGSSVEGLHAGTREGFGDEAVPEGKLEGSVPLTEWMHDSRASEPLSSVEESRDLQPLSVLENAEVISETERLVSDAERRSLDTDDGAPLTEWLRIFGNSSGARESGDSQPIELSGSSDSSQETGTSQTEVENNSQIGVGVSEAELRVGGGEGAPLTEWLTPSRGDRAVLSPDELSVLSSEAPLTEWRPEPSTAGNGVGRTERASPETSFRVPIPLVEPAPSVRNGQRTFPRFLPKGSDRPAFRGELLTGTLSNSEPADRSLFSVNDSDALKALEHPGALTGSNGAEPFSDGAESTSDASQPLPGGHQNVLKSSSSVSDGSQRVLDVSKSLLDASQSFSDGSQSVANVSKSLLDAFSVVTDASPSVLDGPKSVSDGSDEQRTPEWYAVRRWRLTASAFASAVGFFPEQRLRLWEEKLELREPFRGNQMTVWGTKQVG